MCINSIGGRSQFVNMSFAIIGSLSETSKAGVNSAGCYKVCCHCRDVIRQQMADIVKWPELFTVEIEFERCSFFTIGTKCRVRIEWGSDHNGVENHFVC